MTAEELIRVVHAEREEATRAFYAMGLALRELSRKERYKDELGFATFEELVDARYLTSRMTAAKLIAVASTFPAPQAQKLGVEKSYALIRYASVKGQPRDAVRLAISNAVIDGEPVLTISVRELVRATQRLRESLDPPEPSENENAARRAARALQAALRRHGQKSAAAHAHRAGGEWVVQVHLSQDDAESLTDGL